jgi:hypothetical protein
LASRPEKAVSTNSIEGNDEAPKLDLDALMERLRAEVDERRRRSASPHVARPATIDGRVSHTARTLLDLPEAEFVAAAHRAILRREADTDEIDRRLDRLLLGEVTRVGLLRELTSSREGREGGVKIAGLWRAEQYERIRSGPVADWFFNFLQALKTASLLPRRAAQFVRRVDALEKRVAEAALRVEALEQALHDLRPARDGAGQTASDTRAGDRPPGGADA